jgi:hypothetical protein
MPYLSLTLSGQPVDLPADAAVALSYRANDLRNLDGREAAFSETFTLPLTARNVAVLGAPHSLDSLTNAPYVQLPAVLTSPGGVVLLRGFALLEAAGDGYEVTLTDALGSLFAQVGERQLRELDLSAYDHVLSYENVRDASANGSGYTYGLADIGYLAPRPLDERVLYWEQALCVFALTILQAIVAEALPGYRVRGTLLAEQDFQSLLFPQSTPSPQLREGRLKELRVVAAVVARQVYVGTANSQFFGLPLQFPQLLSGDPQLFADGLHYQTPAYTADLSVKLTLRFRLDDGAGPLGSVAPLPTIHVVSVDAQGNDNFRTEVTVQDLKLEQEVVIEANLPVFEAPNVRLKVVVVLRQGLSFILLPGSQVEFTHGSRTYPGAHVHLDATLPDFSQADYLRLLANRYNLVFEADPITKVIYCNLFNDLEKRRKQAVDWTDKIDYAQRPRVEFKLEGYAQLNTFVHEEAPEQYEASGPFLVGGPAEAIGTGELLVPNTTLPAKAEAYAAPVFLPRQREVLGRGPALWLPFWKLYADDDLSKLNPVTPMPVPWHDDPNIPYFAGGSVLHNGRMWLPELSEGTGGDASYFVKPGNAPTLNEVDIQTSDGRTVRRLGWRLTDTVLHDTLNTWALLDRSAAGMVVYDQSPGIGSYQSRNSLTAVGLSFAQALTTYHKGTQAILQRLQLLTLGLRLNALDISGLEYTRPIALRVAHWPGYGKLTELFYLNNIDQYQPGLSNTVNVELIALGLSVPGLAPPVPLPVQRAFVTESADFYALTEAGQYLLVE